MCFAVVLILLVSSTSVARRSHKSKGLQLPGGEPMTKKLEQVEEGTESLEKGLPIADVVPDVDPMNTSSSSIYIKSSQDIDVSVLNGSRSRNETQQNLTTVTPVYTPPPSGPFYNLVVNICNTTITRLSSHKVQCYMTLLQKNIKGLCLGFIMKRAMKRFNKVMKRMVEYKGKLLRDVIVHFLNYVTERMPGKDGFFNAMNGVFSVSDDMSFGNYAYDIQQYGDGRISSVENQTKRIFKKVIPKALKKIEEGDKAKINYNFNLLMLEFYERRTNGLMFG